MHWIMRRFQKSESPKLLESFDYRADPEAAPIKRRAQRLYQFWKAEHWAEFRRPPSPQEQSFAMLVSEDGLEIAQAQSPYDCYQMLAVRSNPYAIQFIDRPCLEARIAAVAVDPMVLEYIEQQSIAVLLEVGFRDRVALKRYGRDPASVAQVEAMLKATALDSLPLADEVKRNLLGR